MGLGESGEVKKEEIEEACELLRKLVEVPTVTGTEAKAGEILKELLSPYVDDFQTDEWFNHVSRLNPEAKRRIAFVAHIDQIGFMIKSIDDEGFLKIEQVGGWDASVPYGQRILILGKKGPVLGVVGSVPPHLRKKEQSKEIKMEDLFVDVGAENREEVEKLGIEVGNYALLSSGFSRLSGTRVTGMAFDDKAGVASIILAARRVSERKGDLKVELDVVATVQEEIGLRGASMIGYKLKPDAAIVVDVTHAVTPPTKGKVEIKLGKGPAIAVGPVYHPTIVEKLRSAAEEVGVPYQIEPSPRGTGTDTWAIQVARGGVKTALLSIPLRYMHSGVEVADLSDIVHASKILAEFALSMS
ncbi:MAG: M42 family peptidase [Thermoproteota archaeon]|nr:MAG: M42 family peptidase [Candidatus Korarchaeota archaeon]